MSNAPTQAKENTVEDPRRARLLDAALPVFLRFGFRKASMDEVARAAQVSRQGLYLHFESKEALFLAALQHALDGSLAGAAGALADSGGPLEARLVAALDAWIGPYVGLIGESATDLAEACGTLGGSILAESEARFMDSLTKSIRTSGLVAKYERARLTARQLAETLSATARGLKYSCPTRESFVERLEIAVRALCLPLSEGS